MKNKIKTEFGTAMINQDGYYEIASVKEGNKDKLLHRLIYERFYNTNLTPDIHIHHLNGRKLDNCIFNLEALPAGDHIRLHRTGSHWDMENMLKLSRIMNNSTNIFRVSVEKSERYTQGFIYKYQVYKDGKRVRLRSVDLDKLKRKVLSNGYEWIEFDETGEVKV